VIFVSHAQVYHGQHHEDKRLQGDDQDVENGPAHLQEAAEDTQNQTGTVHGCDKNENHFTGIHVAKQSQTERKGFGEQTNHFHEKVHWNKCPVVKGMQGQLLDKASTLDFE